MPKKNLEEATIRRIEAEKKAVMDAAQAFLAAKKAQDPTWDNTRQGKNFARSMELAEAKNLGKKRTVMDDMKGYEAQPIYGRLINGNEYGVAKKGAIKRFFSGDYTETEQEVLVAQEKLEQAQKKLHKTMDDTFGTRVARVANENRSLMKAGEFVTDLGKPLTSGFNDFKSILLGGGNPSLTTKPGPFGIPIPTVDRENLPKKAFLTPSFLHNRQGLLGIVGNVAEIFTQTAQAIGERKSPFYVLGRLIGASVAAAFKITGNVLGMAFDAVKAVARIPEFIARAAVAAVVAPVLVAYKGLRGVYKGIRGLVEGLRGVQRPDPDFSLKSHVEANALEQALNSEKNTAENELPESLSHEGESTALVSGSLQQQRKPEQEISGNLDEQKTLDVHKEEKGVTQEKFDEGNTRSKNFSDNMSELTDDDGYQGGSFDKEDSIPLKITPISEPSNSSAKEDIKNSLVLNSFDKLSQENKQEGEVPVVEDKKVAPVSGTGGPE